MSLTILHSEITAKFDTRNRVLNSEPIKIHVGHEGKVYYIHRQLLIEKIPFFEKCLQGNMRESLENEVRLPTESLLVFEELTNWLYGGAMTLSGKPWNLTTRQLAIDLYVLADKWCIETLRNDIVDRFRAFSKTQYLDFSCLNRLRDAGLLQSTLEIYFVDQLAYDVSSRSLDLLNLMSDDDFCGEAFRELMIGGGKLVQDFFDALNREKLDGPGDPSKRSGCVYHDHESTPSC